MSNKLESLLPQLKVGKRQISGALEVFPLFSMLEGGPEYLTLKQALDQHCIQVTELTESGSVPQLRVVNKSEHLVLLLDGEELVGAKQNRVLNTSVLLKGRSETVIPVSCTEQGRWSSRSREFADSDVVMASKARSLKAMTVMASLSEERGFASDQSMVWSEISDMEAKAGVHSSTGAMKDVFASRARELDACVRDFPCLPNQQGILVATAGKVTGLDLLSRQQAYASLHEKLVKSYAMETILDRKAPAITSEDEVRSFLDELAASRETRYSSVGVGEDLRLQGQRSIGSALAYLDSIIHLAFFRMEGRSQDGGMAGFHTRRSYRRRTAEGDSI